MQGGSHSAWGTSERQAKKQQSVGVLLHGWRWCRKSHAFHRKKSQQGWPFALEIGLMVIGANSRHRKCILQPSAGEWHSSTTASLGCLGRSHWPALQRSRRTLNSTYWWPRLEMQRQGGGSTACWTVRDRRQVRGIRDCLPSSGPRLVHGRYFHTVTTTRSSRNNKLR